MNKIVALVVTYNRKEMLKQNIEALLKQKYNEFDILIVDNASTDGTEEIVKSFKENRIIYKNTGANLGGAGGFCYGIKESIESNYEYCWLMDDDTIPQENSLEELIKSSKKLNDEFSYLCSYVQWIDNKPCKMNQPRMDSKWFEYAEKLKDNLIKVRSCTFVSVFINLKIAKNTALPVKEMFIYGDDHEYTERLGKEKEGYLSFNSVVLHKMPSNSGFDIINIPKERISRYFYDSRNRLYRAKKSDTYEILAYFAWLLISVVKIPFKAKDNRLKRIATILKGFFAGIFFNPKLEYANIEKRDNNNKERN